MWLMPKRKVRLNIPLLSSGIKQREPGSSETETVFGAASAPVSECKAAWLCSPSSCSGLAWPGPAQFMLAGQDGIRTCGSWMKAEEGMKRPRWVKVQGWIHSAVWETASRQNQNIEFRNGEI